MSSNLPVTTGGALVSSTGTGGAVGDYVGDVSLDRGPPAGASGTGASGGEGAALLEALQRETGLGISAAQVVRAGELFRRNTLARDGRQSVATSKALRTKWGDAYEGNLQRIHEFLLDTLGEDLTNEVINARDAVTGTAITNKPHVLEAMLKAARRWSELERLAREGSRGGPRPDLNAIRRAQQSARLREIEGWMSTRDPRYFRDEAVQAEYRDLIDQGATPAPPPGTADADVDRRIAEIEKSMGARRGSAEYNRYWNDPEVQREYAELLDRRDRARK